MIVFLHKPNLTNKIKPYLKQTIQWFVNSTYIAEQVFVT